MEKATSIDSGGHRVGSWGVGHVVVLEIHKKRKKRAKMTFLFFPRTFF